jgi:alkylation response protein AidB-like acyl-CoA dehydrogenase
MDLRDRPEDEAFRSAVRAWLEEHVVGEFAALGGRGGSGDETYGFETRLEWERVLAAGRWTGLGWPVEHGGRGASIAQQVIFNEEYVRARAPGRVSVLGEGLLGPTLIQYGTPAQQQRFLPPILAGTELWCQGYSEPDAGSDLANVKTRAERDGDEWVVTGQKVWTSLAHQADWCFVVCRTEPGSTRHHGLSYLLVPMDQPGVEVRPITQLTMTSEFNEVFFDGARTAFENVVGEVGDGWRVALATLGYERGVALLGHQLSFRREFDRLLALARSTGAALDPLARQRLARSYAELEILRYNTLRSLSSYDGPVAPPEASISKLYWASWHQRFCEMAIDLQGTAGLVLEGDPYELDDVQRTFLFSRSETIYGGSNEIQRNIVGERALGLPPEPKPSPPDRETRSPRPEGAPR